MRIFTQDDIDKLTVHKASGERPTVYKKDNFYYKIWRFRNDSFCMMDGLSGIWQGCHTLVGINAGLINEETCPAFVETLHHESGDCIGYCTEEGKKVHESDPKYHKFINKLVDLSIEKGYGIPDMHIRNFAEIRGKISMIDIDFYTIKLNHGIELSENELVHWYELFSPAHDNYYFQLLKEKYLAPLYEK